ncbi:RNA-binding protein 25-like isoform X2 [Ictalurus punctatus]|uniref:RNA-binding protein 25-like isoform X2 n=1 Tax=Ictalurus punctatus TaxID=7998 RepID=A0A2D0SL41_ICTPU|nr:RNA-binding protein 25-like isoform X2 [Ictalurus punctatus]
MCEEKSKSQKSELMKLEEIRRNMEEMLFEVVREFKKERKERERERQYYCDLLAGYEDTKERLEHENANLKDQVTALHGSVEKLERELHETQQMCEEKSKSQKSELMKLEEIRRNMEEMLFEVVREFKKERKERERERKDHRNLLSQYEHIKGSRADAQKNAQNTQHCRTLEKEMLTLMEHLKCMQGLLEDPVRTEL